MRQQVKHLALAGAALLAAIIGGAAISHHQTELDHARGFGPVVLTSGGGGGGTVKTVTGGTGVNVSNPGTNAVVSLDSTVWQTRVTGTAATATAITSINANGTVGTSTTLDNKVTGKHYEWLDDCMWTGRLSVTNTANGLFGEQFVGAGGQVTTNGVTGQTGRPGICQFQTGATTPPTTVSYDSAKSLDPGQANLTFDAVVAWPTLSTSSQEYTAIVGLTDTWASDSSDANVVNGCYMLYDRGNGATSGPNSGNASAFSCWCAASSVRTTYLINGSGNSDESFPLGTASIAALSMPNTNWYHLQIKMTGTTRAEFYYDSGSGLTKVCDINTHMPTSGTLLSGIVKQSKSVGSNSSTLDMDWFQVTADYTNARTP